MSIRVGSVPYLNEKPLTRWFTHTDEGRNCGVDISFDHPSVLATKLAAGEIDAALVSSFEYFRTPGYEIIPGISISGQDEILAVRAFSKIPWRMVESVALDTSSLTSSALLKILLAESYKNHPAFLNHRPDLQEMLALADAALLIGDKGMLADGKGLNVLDLGHGWRELTGMPFVFAVWLAPHDIAHGPLAGLLQKARDWGVTQLEVIAAEQAVALNCPKSLCERYLFEIMDYRLDEEHLTSLSTFGAKAHALGLLAGSPPSSVDYAVSSHVADAPQPQFWGS